jgi:hypothetical protein
MNPAARLAGNCAAEPLLSSLSVCKGPPLARVGTDTHAMNAAASMILKVMKGNRVTLNPYNALEERSSAIKNAFPAQQRLTLEPVMLQSVQPGFVYSLIFTNRSLLMAGESLLM